MWDEHEELGLRKNRTLSSMNYSDYKKLFPKSPSLRPHNPPAELPPAIELPPSSEIQACDLVRPEESKDNNGKPQSLPAHLFPWVSRIDEQFVLEEIENEDDSDSEANKMSPEKQLPPTGGEPPKNQKPENVSKGALYSPELRPRRHSFFAAIKFDRLAGTKPSPSEQVATTTTQGEKQTTEDQKATQQQPPPVKKTTGSIFKHMQGRKKSFQEGS